MRIEGIAALLDREDCPIHVQRDEAPWVTRTTGVGDGQLVEHAPGEVVTVGDIDITLVHTPGHTPGSQCFSVAGRLVSGDTLFLEGCGRTDLPGSDPEKMYESLTKLATLPDDTIVYPGHRYSAPSSGTMAAIRESNYVFRPRTADMWLQMFGGQ
jgi:hydroxyacylglutathione hydrolase